MSPVVGGRGPVHQHFPNFPASRFLFPATLVGFPTAASLLGLQYLTLSGLPRRNPSLLSFYPPPNPSSSKIPVPAAVAALQPTFAICKHPRKSSSTPVIRFVLFNFLFLFLALSPPELFCGNRSWKENRKARKEKKIVPHLLPPPKTNRIIDTSAILSLLFNRQSIHLATFDHERNTAQRSDPYTSTQPGSSRTQPLRTWERPDWIRFGPILLSHGSNVFVDNIGFALLSLPTLALIPQKRYSHVRYRQFTTSAE